MKKLIIICFFAAYFIGISGPTLLDRIESPYFEITSKNAKIEDFPLLSTTANVDIDGVIADYSIIQVYVNRGTTPIEAVYTFPASSRSAVYYTQMKIKDRVIKAVIKEKEEAEKEYEQAKKEGKSASLLTESRPNIFTMNVANIMPNDTITIEIRYAEILEPKEGIYEFVFPAVVGPRYGGNLEGSDPAPTLSYKNTSQDLYEYNINIKLSSGVPLSYLESETHKIIVKEVAENVKEIKLSNDSLNSNRDFVLKYKLRGDKIQTGMIMTENGDENFFLLMLQPPKRVESNEILPKEYTFLVDISGSQDGLPLEISKELMKEVLEKLDENDRFNIITFWDDFYTLHDEPVIANSTNVEKALEYIKYLETKGGTHILQAIKRARIDVEAKGYSKIIAILTDGYVENELETFKYISENLNKTNIFCFGIGSSVNRFYIDGVAQVGLGESFYALNKSNADSLINEFVKLTSSPVMRDIKVDFGDFWASETFPENVPDLFAERPIVVIGKWKKPIKGTIKVSGKTPKEELSVTIPVEKFGELYEGDGLKYLWAKKNIDLLNTYSLYSKKDEYKNAITDLGLKYNLLTKYTSFVAIDSEARNVDGKSTNVNQSVPIPDGLEFNKNSGGISFRNVGTSKSQSTTSSSSNSSGGGYSNSGGYNNALMPTYYRPPIYLGPIFGMRFYNFDNKIDFPNRELLSKNLPEIKGHSYSYGLSYFDFLGEPATTSWNYTIDVTYNSNFLSSNFSILDPSMNNRLVDFVGNEQDSSNTFLNYANQTEYSHLELDFDISYQLFNKIPILINLNLGFQFTVKNHIQEYLEISSDNNTLKFKEIENTKLENDNRKLILIDGDIPNLNKIQIPIGIGISYDLVTKGRSFFRLNYTFGTNLFGLQKDIVNNYFIHKFGIAWFVAL